MRKLLLGIALIIAAPVSVIAGPKDEAYQVIDKFKRAFDASDVQGIVNLFAPDAVFLGTVSPKLVTKTDEINAYFQAIKTDTPRNVEIGDYSTLVLSDTVVVFAGMDQFSSTNDGKKIDLPARFTLVVTNKKPCEELKGEIDFELQAEGAKNYSSDIVNHAIDDAPSAVPTADDPVLAIYLIELQDRRYLDEAVPLKSAAACSSLFTCNMLYARRSHEARFSGTGAGGDCGPGDRR
jgi:uncharacterized protein (TIGR02246 family)